MHAVNGDKRFGLAVRLSIRHTLLVLPFLCKIPLLAGKMNKSAVVFIHEVTTWFPPYALRQALHFEKKLPVILLGDRKTLAPVEFYAVNEIECDERVHEFERNYEHMSTNSRWFELHCWLRWFRLLAFMRREKIDSVFHHDSDVLIQTCSGRIHEIYGSDLGYAALVITDHAEPSSGHSSYWTVEALDDFCSFILHSFKDPAYLRRYRAHFENRQSQGLDGGVCDMTSLGYFWEENRSRMVNFAEVRQGCVFDANINRSANAVENEYVTSHGRKEIVLDSLGQPFFRRRADGKLIQALTIHFQGGAKMYMAGAYRGPFFMAKPLLDLRTWRRLRNKRV